MKILYIVPAEFDKTRRGGVMTYSLLIAEELQKQKHQTAILIPGKVNTEYLVDRVTIYTINYQTMYLRGERLYRKFFPMVTERIKWMKGVYEFINKHGTFDIIETSEWGSSGLLLSLFTKNRIVVRLHRSLMQYYEDNALPKTLDLLLINGLEILSIVLSHAVTSPTKYMFTSHKVVSFILSICQIPHKIIHNGIKINGSYTKQVSKPYILSVGRIEKGKGALLLIHAFKKLCTKFPRLELFIIGRDMPAFINNRWVNYRSWLQQYLIKNDLNRKVHLIPHQSQRSLTQYYQNCTIYVMPSIGSENMPIALLDAICQAKAIVASNAGGIPEIVFHRKNGLIFKETNVENLAAKLNLLLTQPSLRRKFEYFNRRNRHIYNITTIANQIVSLYTEIVTKSSHE